MCILLSHSIGIPENTKYVTTRVGFKNYKSIRPFKKMVFRFIPAELTIILFSNFTEFINHI